MAYVSLLQSRISENEEGLGMINIAIDGPAGAGKSTIARLLAKKLGYIYVDTGALYRAVGLYAVRKGAATKDPTAVSALLGEIDLELKYSARGQRVYMNGEDVSTEIRRPEISLAASDVSAIPAVRAFLLDLQRDMAKRSNVVMDGRDIGTVVLPDAQLKIFLTATPEERARRRCGELNKKGMKADYAKVLKEINLRDKQDTGRKIAPLKAAPDAIRVDSTGCGVGRVLSKLMKIAGERLK
jgi:cytidylate kinase